MNLKPGTTLGGRYEILTRVAEGGMASVWAARMSGSRGFQKTVAIKTMLPAISDDPDFEAMLLDEAVLASRVRHPNAVEVIDVVEERDLIYVVMEWINGETLFTLNKRSKPSGGIPLPLLLRIGASACAGLHAAHELRDEAGGLVHLVHRDVSPQNVMISFDGIVKIVDFGVAKALGRMHETRVGGLMKGKVPYLSPEQLLGKPVDRRSDIFSLGILLYVAVSGKHPFRGTTDKDTMDNICQRAPVPLETIAPDSPPALQQAVMRALEKDADARWQTCEELQRALGAIAAARGDSVTDHDIAAYLREVIGDLIDERKRELDKAIRQADARAASAPPAAAGSSRPAPGRGGAGASDKAPPARAAPLPVTGAAILPLDVGSRSRASAPPLPSLPPPAHASTVRRRDHAPRWPFAVALLGAVALVVGVLAYFGVLPRP